MAVLDSKSRERVPGGIPPRVIYRFPIVSITLKGILYSIVGNYEADFKIGIYKIKQRNTPRGGRCMESWKRNELLTGKKMMLYRKKIKS